MRAVLMLLSVAAFVGLGVFLNFESRAALYHSEWQAFVTRFISDEGRVVDTGNKGISHSEGQGYGMVMASAFDDRETFDRLWRWSRDHLQVRGDHLFAWKWEPGPARATDLNSASDGDILIAWGLLRAARRWQEPAYRTAALAVLDDIRDRLIVDTSIGKALLPGPQGFVKDETIVVNPSYWVFPAFQDFATAHDAPLWNALIGSGRVLIAQARFGDAGLPADWVELQLKDLRLPKGFDTVFGYNAIRVPLYVLWGGLDDADRLNGPTRAWWETHDGAPFIPATVDLATGRLADFGLSNGGRAISVLARFGERAENSDAQPQRG